MPLDYIQHVNLTPQAKAVFEHIEKAGSISALDAFLTMGITSATLARRICDLEEQGVEITRERREHPTTGKRYTRYTIKANPGKAKPRW